MNDRVNRFRNLYDDITKPLVVLSAVWIVLFSTVLPHQGTESLQTLLVRIASYVLLGIWGVFLADYVIYLLAMQGKRHYLKRALYGLLVAFFPTFRLGVPPFKRVDDIWIPFLGWRERGRELEKKLAEAFSLPMIFVVLLVLPILGIELFKTEWIQIWWVRELLELGGQFIWLAFAIEFSLLVSVTRRKLDYCVKHWIDLVIILLPVLLFLLPYLSALPIVRLIRLKRILRTTRLFRMKGAGMKAFQALVLFSGSRRFGRRFHEKRIQKLKELLEEKKEEIEELKEEIERLELERERSME